MSLNRIKDETLWEVADCLAGMFPQLASSDLAGWYANLFGESPAGPQWQRFQFCYLSAKDAVLAQQSMQGSVVVVLDTCAGVSRTADRVGMMSFSYVVGDSLELLDLFVDWVE